MDEALLRVYAAQKSQEHQVLKLVLNKPIGPVQFALIEAAALAELTRKENWRWCPGHGLQVGIPQDGGVRWKARESVDDIKNRVRSITLPNGDPDPNSDRTLFRQDFVWTLSQVLHYGLGLAMTRRDGAALIANALLQGNLEQPAELIERGRLLKAEFKARQSLRGIKHQQQVAETEVNLPDESEGENMVHQAESDSKLTASNQGQQILPALPQLSERVRGKQREASLDISELSENEEEELEDSNLEFWEGGQLSNNYRKLPEVSSAMHSRSSDSVLGHNRPRCPQDTEPINLNLAQENNTQHSRAWLSLLPERYSNTKNTRGNRAASPPLQVIGEGKANGRPQWLPAHFPMSRWLWGGPSAQPAYLRNDTADDKPPAGESTGDAMILSDDSDKEILVCAETTTRGLKRRRANTTSGISTSADGRSVFSIPRSESPIRPFGCLRATSSARSHVDEAFPSAEKSTGQTLGKAKGNAVLSVDVRSTDKSASATQNKDVSGKRRRKKQQLSSEESEADEADKSLPSNVTGGGLSPPKTARGRQKSGGNPTESSNKAAPKAPNVQAAASNEQVNKRVRKKSKTAQGTSPETGNHANGALDSSIRDNSVPKTESAGLKINSKSVVAKKKSASEPATSPGPESVLPIRAADDEAPTPAQTPATRLVSLPPSSEAEARPTRPAKNKKKPRFDKLIQELIFATIHRLDNEFEIVMAKLRGFNEYRRENLPLDDEGPTMAWEKTIMPGKKRSHTAAFEVVGEDSQRAKKTKKNKKKAESLITLQEGTVKGAPSAEVDANADVEPNSEVETNADLELNVGFETNDTKPKEPPKTVASGTTVYQGKKTKYILDCDANGVPAPQAPFRRSPGASKTIRDQLGKPIDPEVVIRNEPRLDVILAKDPETLRNEPTAKAARRVRGGFSKQSPLRSGEVLPMPTLKGDGKVKGKAKETVTSEGKRRREKGKGAFHYHKRSSKMPMKRFSVGGARR